VLRGLSRSPKRLPCKYFYDQTGSELFQQITQTEEYYLTQCELDILRSHCDHLRQWVGPGPLRLVELGVGDGQKTELLLDCFLDGGLDFRFVPIDICGEAIDELVQSLGRKYAADLRVGGLVGDYFDGLDWLHRQDDVPNLVLFLGSSIGNLSPRQTRRFLRRLRASLNPGDHVLIGFDLKKDVALLHQAYNDAAGVTERFNLNLLTRINRELGGNFDLAGFYHHGYYSPRFGRMESWLISTAPQQVHLRRLDRTIAIHAWEGIHMENSYKYDLAEIENAAVAAGFSVRQHLFDSRRYFVDSLWRADDGATTAARQS
jgi:dimethylhistidine N-methyltransferase